MAHSVPQKAQRVASRTWIGSILLAFLWLTPTAVALFYVRPASLRPLIAIVAGLTLAGIFAVRRWDERRRWGEPLHRLSEQLSSLSRDPTKPLDPVSDAPELYQLQGALRELKKAWLSLSSAVPPEYYHDLIRGDVSGHEVLSYVTKSGLLATMKAQDGSSFDVTPSGEFTSDMVSRLEPKTWRWKEASPLAQDFLGWTLSELRTMSFLEIVHPEDVKRVQERFHEALVKGEAHGVVIRIKTAFARGKAIELNVSARYGADLAVTHLRCHITDVTDKVRAERELKLRTRELTQLNEQLRMINREMEDLQDRYRDLYQHAPAMYFTLDPEGRVLECNDTMLRTLGFRREELVGHSFERLLAPQRRMHFLDRYAEFMRRGSIELESQWVKANGESIDVWVSGSAVLGRDGSVAQARNVAQDITAKHRLEAELKEKNERLARTNDELSRKNKELDEFTYVVSHDLQEPLRTLIAFSDFLLKDYGDHLDANGQEYVRHLVDASRRMRSLIHALLTLSRAGRVTGEKGPVNLDEIVGEVKADVAELIRTQGAEIRLPAPLPTVWGDRDRIGQLVANLVVNGLKYNRSDHPWIEIGASPDDDEEWVTIYVRDNGIGIDPQFHGKIFQLFRRLHTREEYAGAGAGLAICAKIVQGHGGQIWVESEPDKGATFYVKLRRGLAEELRPQPALSHDA